MALPTKETANAEVIEGQAVVESVETLPIEAETSLPAAQPATTAVSLATAKVEAEDGFENIVIDFTSFPMVTQEKGTFKIEEQELKEFDVQILSERKQFAVTLFPPDRNAQSETIFSDDGIHNNDGEVIAELVKDKVAQGWQLAAPKEYRILVAKMISANDFEGEYVQLQIPPRSIGKFGGYRLTLQAKKRKVKDVITHVFACQTVGQGQKAFNPWGFKYVSDAPVEA